MLPCGHVICSKCLIGHTVKSIEFKKILVDCPLCRSIIINIGPENNDVRYDQRMIFANGIKILKIVILFCVAVIVLYLLLNAVLEMASVVVGT